MCTNPDRPWPAWDGSFSYDFESIIKRIEAQRDKISQAESLYLTGGEPTLHPNFLEITSYLNDNFPRQRIKLLTNGRRFSYEGFAKKFLNSVKNIEVDLSLYGPNQEIHDQVTRASGSFEQTQKGLANLLKYKKNNQVVGIRTVLTKLSYQEIFKTLSLIRERFSEVDRVIVIFHEIEAQAVKNLDAIKINYQEMQPYFGGLKSFLAGFKEIRFYHFPLCVVGQEFWPHVWKTLPDNEVSFIGVCRNCELKGFCVGIHKGYLENIGREGFGAVKMNKDERIVPSGDKYRPISKIEKLK